MIRNFTNVTKRYDKDGTTLNGYIIKRQVSGDIITETIVPLDPANKDYQAIQEWIAEGNTVIDNGANN